MISPRLPVFLLLVFLLMMFLSAKAIEYRYAYESEPEPVPGILAVDDLSALGERARRENAPIMIEFSTAWCEYCEALEGQILRPMILSGDYQGRLLISKPEANDYSRITGFDGATYLSEDLARISHRAANGWFICA